MNSNILWGPVLGAGFHLRRRIIRALGQVSWQIEAPIDVGARAICAAGSRGPCRARGSGENAPNHSRGDPADDDSSDDRIREIEARVQIQIEPHGAIAIALLKR